MSVALPLFGFAAFNDVTLTTDTVLSVGGVTLNVSGANSIVQSITVGASNFSAVLQPGSVISVSSAAGKVLATDAPAVNISGSECTAAGVSRLTLSVPSDATAAVTVVVTPGSSTCSGGATSSTGASGAPGGGTGGGGGGGGSTVTPATPATPAVPAIPAVPAVPGVAPATPAVPAVPAYIFTRPIAAGVSSSDVKALQRILNGDPDTLIASSGAGSPGKETNYFGPATKKAIQKFQQKHGLAEPGDEGYGTVGPKTRAKLNEIAGRASQTPAATSAVTVPSSVSPVPITALISRSLAKGVSHADVRVLQQILNNDPDTQVSTNGAGSPGSETTLFGSATVLAVQKFQVKYGIAKPGDDGYGTVGPRTRAKLNELSRGSAPAPTVSPSPAPAQTSTNTADVAKQLDDSLKLLQALQAQLKALK